VSLCAADLRVWLNGKRHAMPFAVPMVWTEPKDYLWLTSKSDDCPNLHSTLRSLSQSGATITVRPEEARGKYYLLLLVSCLDYSSILKMEAIYFSETSSFYQTTRHYSPKHRTPRSHRCENLVSSMNLFYLILVHLRNRGALSIGPN
jgi:hypothetical protein